jgi:hypothetical protein
MQRANIIKQQIGIAAAIIAGAKHFSGSDKESTFAEVNKEKGTVDAGCYLKFLMRGKRGVMIVLEPDDTYHVIAYKINTPRQWMKTGQIAKFLCDYSGIYAENLRNIIKEIGEGNY